MSLGTLLPVAAFAALAALVYDRSQVLYTFYGNAPARLARVKVLGSSSVKFADRMRSCEDVLLVEDRGVAIVACDAGRERWNTVMGVKVAGPVDSAELYLYDYKDGSLADSEALRRIETVGFAGSADFHTLGIAYEPETSTLYATNHARAGGARIEVFALDLDGLRAVHTGSLQHPLLHAPNAIKALGAGELYVTNDHHFPATTWRLLSRLETMLGPPLGSVVHVKLSPGGGGVEQARVVTRVPFANGIELLNSSTLAVSATNRAAVYLFDMAGDGSLAFRSQIRLPFLPDNLSLSRGGTLLIAGHAHLPSLARFTATRHVCNDAAELARATDDVRRYCETEAAAPSWVAEWSEAGGLRSVYVETEYPSSATAARDDGRGVGIVAGLYAKGLLVWRE